ncbi:hypothetical protein PAXINDRAFT_20762 [Paxillus involutus ATCC 200175]|uniref:CxC1-like cysteine cluster associated with KDZ transposases domain-containing protein n=1 Tax=Paxillus involutus ATCC 200175 TaxID=664439 RepID=A0A0C9SUC2_PAXIN|nr:hypothetical protein PAXINDRAFT_20762 [Paxillus involutus ATCC 200175]
MAVRRPRLAKSRSHSLSKRSSHRRDDDTPEPSTSHLPHVNPFLTAPSSLSRRRLRNTGGLQLLNVPVLVLPGRRRLVQQGRQAQFPGVQGHGRQGDHNTGGDGGPDVHMVNDDPPFSDAVYFPNEDDTLRVPCISNRQKRLNQWNRWSTEVIPSLVPLWRAYLRKTSNLRIPALPKNTEGSECFCDSGVEQIVLHTCACASAPSQLMAMGLFGCAPIAPSLAVDLRLLQFVKTLFVRLTPNTTVWCEALAVFLQERGYGLTTQDNLRRRFSNAYHWYIVLVMHNKELVSGIINASSSRHECETSDSEEEEGGAHEDAEDPQRLQYPSDYLCSRCPLCFVGLDWRKERDSLVDVIVCIDACFTQKCSKNPRGAEGHDPPNPTSSAFIPSETVTQMEVHVERCRSKGKERGRRVLHPSEDEDRVEEGMRVPASVLNGCGESFVAADEKREKASTHFFADTGLMALLCRHDCVL